MTPAEELAAAADKLEALIVKVPAGPWVAEDVGSGDADVLTYQVLPTSRTAWAAIVGDVKTDHAAYIAAMNPLVGADLVVLLREFAAHVERRWRDFHEMWNSEQRIRMIGDHAPGLHAVLRIARQINGTAVVDQ